MPKNNAKEASATIEEAFECERCDSAPGGFCKKHQMLIKEWLQDNDDAQPASYIVRAPNGDRWQL